MIVHFAETARSYFDTLAERFGLKCTTASNRELSYENARVSLTIRFDPGRSFELGVEISDPADSNAGPPFSLAEVLRLGQSPESEYVDGLMVTNPQSMKRALARLADLTERFAAELLRGDDATFAELAQQRAAESAGYERQMKLRQAMSDADKAWRGGDFPAVVAALSPVEQLLSDAQKKRLAIARKRAIARRSGH